ncbi:MAG: RDD family protein [Aliishimia sp.]
MTYESTFTEMSDLPDPTYQPEFYASVAPKRFLAWVVDSGLILILTLIALPFTGFLGIFFLPVMFLVLGFAYRVVTLSNGSATWGMRLCAIEMRRWDGRRFDFEAAILHTLGYSISMALPLVQVVSIVLMLTSSRGQGLTDHLLGSTALNKPMR